MSNEIVRCCDENTPHVAYCEAALKALIDQRIASALAEQRLRERAGAWR